MNWNYVIGFVWVAIGIACWLCTIKNKDITVEDLFFLALAILVGPLCLLFMAIGYLANHADVIVFKRRERRVSNKELAERIECLDRAFWQTRNRVSEVNVELAEAIEAIATKVTSLENKGVSVETEVSADMVNEVLHEEAKHTES